MSDSTQLVASSLLPGLRVDYASFGIVIQRGTAARRLHSTIPLRQAPDYEPPPRVDGHLPVIMAVGADRIAFVHFGPDRVAADMLSVSDVQAELTTVGGRSAVRLRSSSMFREHLNCEFCWDFVVGEDSGSGQEKIARSLVDLGNKDGDYTRSGFPVVRFIARSIAAHQNDTPAYLSEILPKGYQAFVETKSVAGAIATLAGEEGWFKSFESVFQVRPPDADEIFLLFEPGRWILTDRRIYLIDASHIPAAYSLSEIRSYRMQTFLRQRVEIRLHSGMVITRPAAGRQYLSAGDFDRVLRLAYQGRASGVRVKRQAG